MQEFKKLEKKALYSMYITTLIATVITMIVLGVIIYAASLYRYKMVMPLYIAIGIFAVLNAIISPSFRYNRYRYKLDNDSVEIISGYIFVSHAIVPIERIQNLEVCQGPFDKLFGVANVTVTTGGGDVAINYISKANADIIANVLKRKINEAVIEEKQRQAGDDDGQ